MKTYWLKSNKFRVKTICPLYFSICVIFGFQCTCKESMTLKEIESDLHQSYLSYFNYSFIMHNNCMNHSIDSLYLLSKSLENKLLKYTSEYPYTMNCKFDSLSKDGFYITTSKDKCLKIYSYDDLLGGSMRYFSSIFQYKFNNMTYSFLKKDCYRYYSIYKLNTNHKTYYLLIGEKSISSQEENQTIEIFSIGNQAKLDSSRIIRERNILTNSLDIRYNYSSIAENEQSSNLIKYDEIKKTIYIPIVTEDGDVIEGYKKYQFNGECFDRVLGK